MAYIDKVYGTATDWQHLRSWLRLNRPDLQGNMYRPPINGIGPISNFTYDQDMWLLENCPLEFIQKRLREQYSLKEYIMSDQTIGRLPELKRCIAKHLSQPNNVTFPLQLEFSEGMEKPLYKITIEVQAKDFFIDQNGVRWIRDNAQSA